MATRDLVKNSLYFGFTCSLLKSEVGDPIFVLLESNQQVAIKLLEILKKILGSGFRATLTFGKINLALNSLPRIFYKVAESLTVAC